MSLIYPVILLLSDIFVCSLIFPSVMEGSILAAFGFSFCLTGGILLIIEIFTKWVKN
jgi:hypothetical protein